MSKHKRKSTQLNCFSPPVMLATLLIEFSLAGYALWRYKLNSLSRLIAALLVCLGVFQLAEYFVCTSPGPSVGWSKIGFVAITALPPLGLHIMHKLAGRPARGLMAAAYATMLACMVFFMYSTEVFTGHQCTGNYVIFHFSEWVTGVYTIYYVGWVIAGMLLGYKWGSAIKGKSKKARLQLQTIQGLLIGYLAFLIPSGVSIAITPEAFSAVPSVLCGFAVLLALILALYILPRAVPKK